MLQQPRSLLFHELANHVAENGPNSIESLVGGTDVVQPVVVQQDLLNNEDGNSLAELGASLHDSETEGNYLGSQEEVDNLGGVILDQSADDTEAGEPEVLERSRL